MLYRQNRKSGHCTHWADIVHNTFWAMEILSFYNSIISYNTRPFSFNTQTTCGYFARNNVGSVLVCYRFCTFLKYIVSNLFSLLRSILQSYSIGIAVIKLHQFSHNNVSLSHRLDDNTHTVNCHNIIVLYL